jgi:sulfur carrier protein
MTEAANIRVHLNGQMHDLAPTTSVSQLLQLAGFGERRVAVERNGEIIPRSQHASTLLASGDRIEIVQAIGGG